MTRLLGRLFREEDGQDLIEYGLLVGVITIGAITAIAAIGPLVAGYYEQLQAALTANPGG